jgi:general nucleoside transport system ATP-binding protein
MNAEDDAGPEVVLRLDGISKRFGALLANDNLSLTVRRGEIVGLLGENGAGKTTLMNILFGHYLADAGTIHIRGELLAPGSPAAALAAGIGMVHQHFTLADNLTVLENIVLGTERLFALYSNLMSAKSKIAKLSADFGLAVDPGALVGGLSVGEQQRVEILKALYRHARILILDEPTAVLTPQESVSLFDTLKRLAGQGLSIILISHKLTEVLSVCSRVAVLRDGRMVAERDSSGVTAAELGTLMVGRVLPAMPDVVSKPGPVVLRVSDLSACIGSQIIDGIDLSVRSGEILGIAGVSGNGQSLLAALIAGVVKATRGNIAINGNVVPSGSPAAMIAAGVARIPEDRHAEGLIGDMSITENMVSESYGSKRFRRGWFVNWPAARKFAAEIIQTYSVKCPSPEVKARLLSGGNMQKLILGRAMAGSPVVVLANQPTRGLDVGAVRFVHEQLMKAKLRGAAVVLISEDLDELFALSDRVSVMYRGQMSVPGNRATLSIDALGLHMAGQGFSHAA